MAGLIWAVLCGAALAALVVYLFRSRSHVLPGRDRSGDSYPYTIDTSGTVQPPDRADDDGDDDDDDVDTDGTGGGNGNGNA